MPVLYVSQCNQWLNLLLYVGFSAGFSRYRNLHEDRVKNRNVLKTLPNRIAVSGLILRFPAQISLIHVAGTWMLWARWYLLIPSGTRNSSRRISPGMNIGQPVHVSSPLMIAANFNPTDPFLCSR